MSSSTRTVDPSVVQSGQVDYIRAKTEITITGSHAGETWWSNVTISPEQIPMCHVCVDDTRRFKEQVKERKGACFKPSCHLHCVWFDFSHEKRRQYVGCKCSDHNIFSSGITNNGLRYTCGCGAVIYEFESKT